MIALIHSPNQYDGAAVKVVGFATSKFEGTGLFFSRIDFEHGVSKNGLWLDIDPLSHGAVDESYVVVEGTFDSTNRGHLQMWSGAITKVTRLERWSGNSE
jgi:hypothetical protein